MSAYIVDDETIDRAIQAIEHAEGTHSTCEQLDVLGQQLLDMNVAAVNQRYPNDTEESSVYRYTPRAGNSLVQLLKSAECLHYQCSEGDIPETSLLYKRLEQAIDRIRYSIISAMPEYREAKWA